MNETERAQIRRNLQLVLIATLGVIFALMCRISGAQRSVIYTGAATTLLFIGLYFAVYFIDKEEAKRHWRIVAIAVTFGVICKYFIILLMTLVALQQWQYAVFAMAMAQIDPLSVAAISKDSRMNAQTKAVLNAWASFDDPITGVATWLMLGLIAKTAHQKIASDSDWSSILIGLSPFILTIVLVTVFKLTRLPRAKSDVAKTGIVGAIAFVAIPLKAFSASALAGWFIRPKWLSKFADKFTQLALCGATFMLGMILADGVNVIGGIVLGVATYLSQIVVGWLVMRLATSKSKKGAAFSTRDTWQIALAQQNGITAIVLALNLETMVSGAIATIALAILVVNTLNFGANMVFDRIAPKFWPET